MNRKKVNILNLKKRSEVREKLKTTSIPDMKPNSIVMVIAYKTLLLNKIFDKKNWLSFFIVR